jgi:hypothetical protein
MAAIALDLQDDDKDDSLFMLCLLNYQRKTSMVKVLLTVEIFHENLPRAGRSSSPLSSYQPSICFIRPSWCYRYTGFTNQQLQVLFEQLNPPPCFIIHNGKCHCSSEEAFIITFLKLAMGVESRNEEERTTEFFRDTDSVCHSTNKR